MIEKTKYDELERIFNLSRDLIGSGNLEGYFIKINSSFREIIGYTEKEFLENPFINFVYDEDVEKTKQALAEAVNGKETIDIDNRYKCKDGSYKWISWRILSIANENRFIAVGRDITERIHAENALKESEEKYRLLADNVTDAICIIHLDKLGFEYTNPSFETIFGYKEEACNLNVYDFLTPDSAEHVMEVLQRELEKNRLGRAAAQRLELEVRHKEGFNFWIGVSARFLRDDKNRVVSILCVVRDTTKRKNAEDALHKATIELEEKVKERTVELQEKNTTLKVLLEQRGDDKKNLEEAITSNVKELITPNINRLKNSKLSSKQKTALNVLESNLNEIVSPFSNQASSNYMKLTPTEIQAANFIKHGASTKDIAESLGLSQRTVDTHRYNIRKKIGISGKSINLRTYLSSLT